MKVTGTPDIVRAKYYAEIKHSGQTYNDEVPYTYHLDQVHSVLVRFGVRDINILVASQTHDLIEDQGVSYNDIKDRFGEAVAELVFAVTNEMGRNRKERAAKTYPKIAGNIKATILKLSDRIANVEYGIASGSKQVEMYKKEQHGFYTALHVPYSLDGVYPGDDRIIVTRMWEHLNKLLEYRPTDSLSVAVGQI